LSFEWDLDYDGASFQTDAVGVGPTVSYATPGNRTIALRVTDPLGLSHLATTKAQVGSGSPATVVGRHIFYNQSKFDLAGFGANPADDAAIATDKVALLPGQTSSFVNYTSYGRGINGIMVDIKGMPNDFPSDGFEFKVGNSATPSEWATAPAPFGVGIRVGAGVNNSTRLTILWPNNAIAKQWLQVTVKAVPSTGLTTPDVFYFGNAVGESGNVAGDYSVSITDEIIARNNPVSINPGTSVTNRFDYNRDGTVSVVDQILARNNITTGATKLTVFTAPAALQASGLKAQGLMRGLGNKELALRNAESANGHKGNGETIVPPTAVVLAPPVPAMDKAVQSVFAEERLPSARRGVQVPEDLLQLLSQR
jgi:hypothetical protein